MFWTLATSDPLLKGLESVAKEDLASVLVPAVFSFAFGILIAPSILRFLVRRKLWRKQKTLLGISGKAAPITAKLNKDGRRQVPRMGGLVVVGAVAFTTLFFWLLSLTADSGFIHSLDYASRDAGRSETWLVLFSLFAGALIGILDDLVVTDSLRFLRGKLRGYIGGGLSLSLRLAIISLIGLVCSLWWYFKLDVTSVTVPLIGVWELGIWIIPFLIIIVMATYSGGIIDGIDGLSGGVFAIIFSTYAVIALTQGHFNLATFCLVVAGALLAFLWHNIPPAKFYLSETGSMALTVTLSIVAFMTDTIFLLPVIAFPAGHNLALGDFAGADQKVIQTEAFSG